MKKLIKNYDIIGASMFFAAWVFGIVKLFIIIF